MQTTNLTPSEWIAMLAERAANRAAATRAVLAEMVATEAETTCDWCKDETAAVDAHAHGAAIICDTCYRCERGECAADCERCAPHRRED